jgi:polysaccharide biosynthesis/export protein
MKKYSCSQSVRQSKTFKPILVVALFFACSPSLLASMQQPADSAQQPIANAGRLAKSEPATEDGTSKTPRAQASSPPANSVANDRYRIGPGDVLDIRVFNKPQFSRESVRVDGRGMIRMPLLTDEIRAACKTEAELASELTSRYLEYLRNPQIDVFIKDYQSQPVAVVGAVRVPSRFQLQRRVRLLELLSHAGGPADNAGRSIQIVHTAKPSICETAAPSESEENVTNVVDNYKLDDTMKGDEAANPYVRPGDVVSVTEAEQAFVVGNVLRPSAIPLKEQITVSRAIAMSGGTMPDTKNDRVRIVRQPPGSTTKTEIFVDLKAIDKQRAEDIVLQAGDIVDVPTSGTKRLLRSLIGAVVPSVAQLPVRVIP